VRKKLEMSDEYQGDGPGSQSSIHSRWVRAWIYALAWLAPLAFMFWFVTRVGPTFQKLDERGELPALNHWASAFVRLNQPISIFLWSSRLLGRRFSFSGLGGSAWPVGFG
jgi:hypothetical protein